MLGEHSFETPPVALRTGLPTPGGMAPQEGDSGEGAHLRLVEAKSPKRQTSSSPGGRTPAEYLNPRISEARASLIAEPGHVLAYS
jgi:hypothetical protein